MTDLGVDHDIYPFDIGRGVRVVSQPTVVGSIPDCSGGLLALNDGMGWGETLDLPLPRNAETMPSRAHRRGSMFERHPRAKEEAHYEAAV